MSSIGYSNSAVDPAHHGTTDTCAEAVLADKFLPSVDTQAYLGRGVYFFDGNEQIAEKWAQKAKEKRKSSGWALLRARVTLGTCLDLTSYAHCKLVKEMARQLKERNVQNVTEAVAISALVELDAEVKVDTVRAVQRRARSEQLIPGGHFYSGNIIIICVVETDMISNVQLVC